MGWMDGEGFDVQRPKTPDLKEMMDRLKERVPRFNTGFVFGVTVFVALIVWAFTGIYIVHPDEVGVVKRFGKYNHTTQPGPHWHIPWPIEVAIKVKVTKVHRLEVGYRTTHVGPPARYQTIPKEALMLTGDENIVSCEFIVQYMINDPVAFLFNVREPVDPDGQGGFIQAAAEAAMREVVGRNGIDEVLTEAKDMIQIEARDLLQAILDDSNLGVSVQDVKLQDVYPPDQVIDAFRDVASAREDRETLRNQAEAYSNDILPKARGEAEKRINEARAYRATKIAAAEGDAARFNQLYVEYKQAKEVTRKRLYLDAMRSLLANARIVLTDDSGSGVLPLLPLETLGEKEAK